MIRELNATNIQLLTQLFILFANWMGTSMANFFKRNSYLSEKQVSYWRALQKNGQMRIEIYAGQLLEVALEKTQAAAG